MSSTELKAGVYTENVYITETVEGVSVRHPAEKLACYKGEALMQLQMTANTLNELIGPEYAGQISFETGNEAFFVPACATVKDYFQNSSRDTNSTSTTPEFKFADFLPFWVNDVRDHLKTRVLSRIPLSFATPELSEHFNSFSLTRPWAVFGHSAEQMLGAISHCPDSFVPIRSYAGDDISCIAESSLISEQEESFVLRYAGEAKRYVEEKLEPEFFSDGAKIEVLIAGSSDENNKKWISAFSANERKIQAQSRGLILFSQLVKSNQDGKTEYRMVFHDQYYNQSYVIDHAPGRIETAFRWENLIEQVQKDRKNVAITSPSQCFEGQQFDIYTWNDKSAEIENCIEGLEELTGKNYEKVICEDNWLTPDDYCIRAAEN